MLTPLTYIHVGNIDIEVCDICGKKVKVIACIEDSAVIKKILTHLKVQAPAIKNIPCQKAGHHHKESCLLIKMDDLVSKRNCYRLLAGWCSSVLLKQVDIL